MSLGGQALGDDQEVCVGGMGGLCGLIRAVRQERGEARLVWLDAARDAEGEGLAAAVATGVRFADASGWMRCAFAETGCM